MKRLTYIDWLRGLAVLIMILWHSLDSWTAASARHGATFDFIVLAGGWAAPLFLFLAGVSMALAGAKASSLIDAAAADRRAISWTLQKRGWQIFLIAHLFRLQAFLLNPSAPWAGLLKPDILNILGLGMVAVAWCWGRATTRPRQIAWLLGPAAAIVLLTPGSRIWSWPTLFRAFAPRLEAYIRPVTGMGVFSLFPWVAFVFVGAFVGMHIAAHPATEGERRRQLELAVTGVLIGAAGFIGMHLPALSSQSSFWTTSVSFFLIRTGGMTLLIPAAWAWMSRPTSSHWSPMVVFGQTSLFVYWVHVELAYGVFTLPLHAALSLRAALIAYFTFTAFMLGLAVVWRRRAPLDAALISPRRSNSGSS